MTLVIYRGWVAWLRRRTVDSPEDRFSDEVAGLARFLLRATVHQLPDFCLEIHSGGRAPITMNLGNVFAEVRGMRAGERRARLRTVILALTSTSGRPSWDDAAPRLLPAVRGARWAAATSPATVVRRPLVPFLNRLCAIDSEHAMTFVTDTDLLAWGVTEDEVMQRATDNLTRMTIEVGRTGPIAVLLGPDGYISSWLAAPWALSRIAERVGDTVVAVAAARDHLVLVDAADPVATVRVLAEALVEYGSAPRQLSPVAYLVGSSGITVWDPPPDHPARPLAGKAVRMLAAVEYGRQRATVQDLMTRAGADVRVSSCTVMENPDGSVWSWAAWVRQVGDGLLPRADVLVLVDHDDPGAGFDVPWSLALTIAEHCLEPSGYDPPLWRHRGWPDAPTLAALRNAAGASPPLR